MQLHEILKRPLITEKNATLQPTGKYVFEVGGRANKMQIKNAVEEAFKVTVVGCNSQSRRQDRPVREFVG